MGGERRATGGRQGCRCGRGRGSADRGAGTGFAGTAFVAPELAKRAQRCAQERGTGGRDRRAVRDRATQRLCGGSRRAGTGERGGGGAADRWRSTGAVRCSVVSRTEVVYSDMQPKKADKQVVRSTFPVTQQHDKSD